MSSGEFAAVESRLDDVERLLARGRRPIRRRLVVVDAAELARLPGAIETYRAALALVARRPAGDRRARRPRDRPRRRRRRPHHVGRVGPVRPRLLGQRGPRGRAPRLLDRRRRAPPRRALSPTCSAARSPWPTSGSPRDASATPGAPSRTRWQLAAHEAGRRAAGYGGHARRPEPDRLRARRPRRGRRPPGPSRGAGRAPGPAAAPVPPAGRPRPAARGRRRPGRRASTLLEEAERVYVGDFSPDVRPVPAHAGAPAGAQGRLSEALDWAREHQLSSADDDLSYVREYEHVTLARILLPEHAAEGSPAALRTAYGLLERSASPPRRAGERAPSSRSWSCRPSPTTPSTASRRPGRLGPLERALRLAEPEGYVRVFVGEGAPMATLLEALARDAHRLAVPAPPARRVRRQGRSTRRARARAGPRRPAQRPRARRAPAARHRPRRAGHRARARRVAQHRAHAHQEHLRQARREQPPRGGHPGRASSICSSRADHR